MGQQEYNSIRKVKDAAILRIDNPDFKSPLRELENRVREDYEETVEKHLSDTQYLGKEIEKLVSRSQLILARSQELNPTPDLGGFIYGKEGKEFETSIGKGNKGIVVRFSYSGFPKEGLLGWIKSFFFKRIKEISMETSIESRKGTERLPSLLLYTYDKTPHKKDNAEQSVAKYLHEVLFNVKTRLITDGVSEEDLSGLSFFADKLVSDASKCIGRNIIPAYLREAAKYDLRELVDKEFKGFKERCQESEGEFKERLSELKEKSDKLTQFFEEKRKAGDELVKGYAEAKKEDITKTVESAKERLANLEKNTSKNLEERLLKETMSIKSSLETEVGRLKNQVVEMKRKAIGENSFGSLQVYFIEQLDTVFPNYDTCPDSCDVTPEFKVNHSRDLASYISEGKSFLDEKSVMKVISEFSQRARKSRKTKFIAEEINQMIKLSKYVAEKIHQENMGMFMSNLSKLCSNRKKRLSELQKIVMSLTQ